ncbi:GATA transcription factor 1-like [Impatiens glandulifera]|uniref:GATA transcription factor 1-like n=1 Tax=Impatiens glandulifera TaxID=253017 RepID=UPI001FB15AA9|nr:GATA transcription factor 1-like [Impatiens glandulifera]
MDDGAARFMVDDLLDFTLDAGEVDDEIDEDKTQKPFSASSSEPSDDRSLSFPECVEEELEWISNKDAFPSVDTFFNFTSNNHESPISVLENSSNTVVSHSQSQSGGGCYVSPFVFVPVQYPVKARSKRRRRHRRGFPEIPSQYCFGTKIAAPIKVEKLVQQPRSGSSGIGRSCQHCGAEKTPQWRAGPMGPKTLCNACGVRFKSGRLVPEYRPASSPSYSASLHSNSHRKIVEMRRQKQVVVDIGM